MLDSDVLSSCRLCLEPGAVYPIFEASECENILRKLTVCLKEKLEDIDGYPRSICIRCSSTIDTICEFIHKYEETAKILNNKVVKVKTEDTEHYDDDLELDSLCSILENVPKTEHVDKDPDEILSSLKEITIKRLTDDKTHINNNDEYIGMKVKQETSLKGVKNINSVQHKKEPKVKKSHINKRIHKKNKKEIGAVSRVSKENNKKQKIKSVDVSAGNLCEICGDVVNKNRSLAYHHKKMHSEKKFKCAKCPKTFKFKYTLHKHAKCHGVKNLICDLCGKCFYSRDILIEHIRRIHEDIKKKALKFKCSFCDKSFGYRRGSIIHERSVHTGERPSVCTICNASFYDELYLREHMRLHTGENPFKCPICWRGYAQRGNMKSHMRNHKISELDPEVLKKLKPSYLKFLKP